MTNTGKIVLGTIGAIAVGAGLYAGGQYLYNKYVKAEKKAEVNVKLENMATRLIDSLHQFKAVFNQFKAANMKKSEVLCLTEIEKLRDTYSRYDYLINKGHISELTEAKRAEVNKALANGGNNVIKQIENLLK